MSTGPVDVRTRLNPPPVGVIPSLKLDPCAGSEQPRLAVEEGRARQILRRHTERLEHGNLLRGPPPRHPPLEQIADLATDVLGSADRPLPHCQEVVAGLGQGRFASIDEERGGRDRGAVELPRARKARPYCIDVSAGRDPLPPYDRITG